MSQVINILIDRMVAQVKETMQSYIDPNDLTYVDVVKKGLLQTDKVKENVQIGITGGDHEDPEYKDGIIDLARMPNVGMRPQYAREIGGGQMWWRRGVARLEIFYVREKLTEDAAFEAAYEILGRLSSTIEQTNLNGLMDSFGEQPVELFCFGNTFFESGGPPKNFIFRGKILWQCLTERP